jgi:hypothetical protein
MSTLGRLRRKQSDADEIKSWDKELTRAYERFNVRIKVELLTLRIPLTTCIDQRPPRHSGPYRGPPECGEGEA